MARGWPRRWSRGSFEATAVVIRLAAMPRSGAFDPKRNVAGWEALPKTMDARDVNGQSVSCRTTRFICWIAAFHECRHPPAPLHQHATNTAVHRSNWRRAGLVPAAAEPGAFGSCGLGLVV